jgi:hypothetical protein
MSFRSFLENLGDWEALHANFAPLLTDLPYLTEDHAALVALTAVGRELESEQDIHKRMLRETNLKRNALQVQGRKLRSKLVQGARSKFGDDNIQLLQYGIQPRQPRRRNRPSARNLEAKKAAEAEAARSAPTTPPQEP